MSDEPSRTYKIAERDEIVSAIQAPSDRLTLGQLRRVTANNQLALEALTNDLFVIEHDVVFEAAAFVAAPPASSEERLNQALIEENMRELAALYVKAGLAAGPHEAAHLVESFVLSLTAQKPFSNDRSGRG
jgi:hypothetical protein